MVTDKDTSGTRLLNGVYARLNIMKTRNVGISGQNFHRCGTGARDANLNEVVLQASESTISSYNYVPRGHSRIIIDYTCRTFCDTMIMNIPNYMNYYNVSLVEFILEVWNISISNAQAAMRNGKKGIIAE